MSNEIYQRLEYLDNGKAGNVISIGNYPGAISFCYVKYSFEQLPETVPNALFGAFSGKGTKFRPRSTASKVAWYTYSSYGSEIQAFNHTTVAKSIYEGMWNVNSSWSFKKDGTRIAGKDSIGYGIGSFQDVPIYVFGSNQNGSISESCRIRLYKLNLSIANNSVYQLIPAKRVSDGVCGLFNEKSGAFYTALDDSTKYEFTGPGLNEYFDADMKSIRPATLEEKLINIEETKTLIKEAIISKGIEVSDTDSFRSYVDKIDALKIGELTLDEYNICLDLSKEIMLPPEPEYTILACVENDSKAYVDTGINPYGKNLRYEFKFGPISNGLVASGSSYKYLPGYLFGGYNTANGKNLGTFECNKYTYGSPDSILSFYAKESGRIAYNINNFEGVGYSASGIEGFFEIKETTFSYSIYNKNNQKTYEGSGAVAGEFPQTPTITLFCQNTENGADTTNFNRATFYYFKIYLDDIVVRDFIPVRDGYGTVCLYDKVSRSFFYAKNGNLQERS